MAILRVRRISLDSRPTLSGAIKKRFDRVEEVESKEDGMRHYKVGDRNIHFEANGVEVIITSFENNELELYTRVNFNL